MSYKYVECGKEKNLEFFFSSAFIYLFIYFDPSVMADFISFMYGFSVQ